MRKNRGAAASTPTKLGFPLPEKSPIQTTSTYRPTTPADHASRKPQEVPVFQATGQRVRVGREPSSSGRGLRRSMSRVMKAASGLNRRGPVAGCGPGTPGSLDAAGQGLGEVADWGLGAL